VAFSIGKTPSFLEVLVRHSLLILTCIGLACAYVPARADESASKNAANKTTESKAPVNGPRIAVDPPEHNFGKALQNTTLTKEFSVKNFGTEDLVITNVATTCGCTVAQLSTKTLKPGASTPLIVTLETRSNNGPVEKLVTIESNDPSKKMYDLKLKVEVSPEKP
jgi:hypothetical protein